jgi:hypothetical protein
LFEAVFGCFYLSLMLKSITTLKPITSDQFSNILQSKMFSKHCLKSVLLCVCFMLGPLMHPFIHTSSPSLHTHKLLAVAQQSHKPRQRGTAIAQAKAALASSF